jgi:diaminopimelate epimerase
VVFDWLKGHGTENDFVLLPDHDGAVHGRLEPALAVTLCHRRRGIGADGVLRVIRTSAMRQIDPTIPATDAEWFMDYLNSDGSMSEMCGNGVRVFALHLAEAGLVKRDELLPIGTRAGTRTVTFGATDDADVSVDMGLADLQGHSQVWIDDRTWRATKISMGNPHAVAFVDDLAEAGSLVEPPRHVAADFPEGVNVEFVRRIGPGEIEMRVFERGSGETRSCGTGACAAAVAAAVEAGQVAPLDLRVDVPGGVLGVHWHPDGRVDLSGPAEIVARGEWLRG